MVDRKSFESSLNEPVVKTRVDTLFYFQRNYLGVIYDSIINLMTLKKHIITWHILEHKWRVKIQIQS